MAEESSGGAAASTVALLDGVFEPVSDVVVERVEGELVLLDLQRNEVFGLNEVGSMLWDTIARGGAPRAVVALVTEAFEIDEQTVLADVSELLEVLLAKGLVRRR